MHICFRHPVEKEVPDAPSLVGWTQLHPTFILDTTKSSFLIFRGLWRILTLCLEETSKENKVCLLIVKFSTYQSSELPSLHPYVYIMDLPFQEVHLTGIDGEDLMDADREGNKTTGLSMVLTREILVVDEAMGDASPGGSASFP